MIDSEAVAGKAWVRRNREEWPPAIKLILAFVIGLLLLSPAILGLYWEILLP